MLISRSMAELFIALKGVMWRANSSAIGGLEGLLSAGLPVLVRFQAYLSFEIRIYKFILNSKVQILAIRAHTLHFVTSPLASDVAAVAQIGASLTQPTPAPLATSRIVRRSC